MRLQAITIERFGSFANKQRFDFPQAPGLYFMQGRNLANPRMGGNGVGKSTLWDALFWLAFERTPDGRKAGDVCNWRHEKGVKVELQYADQDGQAVSVERTWKPNSWTYAAHEVQDLTKKGSANPFLADINASASIFQQCVLMAQGEPMFLDLKREAQAEMFSTVLGLDRWLELGNKASQLQRKADDECRRLESEVARLEGKTEAQTDYSQQHAEWESARELRIGDLMKDFEFCNSGLIADKAALEKVEQEIRDKEKDIEQWQFERKDLAPIIEKSEAELMILERKGADLKQRVMAINDCVDIHHGAECPSCGLSLDSNAAEKVRVGMLAELEEITPQVKKILKQVDKARFENGELFGSREELDAQIAAHNVELDRLDSKARSLRNAISLANRRLDDIEDGVDLASKERNPFAAMQKEALERARIHQEQLAAAREALDKANEKYSLYGFWARSGFKDLRLQQIAEALAELEIEVNSSLTELGLEDWEMRFAVDRETKGGSIQRGFNVSVRSPTSPKLVPWAAWSGGERRRLCNAGNMGLANLIRSRMGVSIPLEVWDEPTEGLSPQGVKDLFNCLERRARVEQRQIWVIAHTAHDFGGFAGIVTVALDEDGAHIEQN